MFVAVCFLQHLSRENVTKCLAVIAKIQQNTDSKIVEKLNKDKPYR